jgi:UDP-N-acetylmuramoyl-L-alanyl-D-glutamate--2,6-diaminopimelate ligase
MSTRQLKSLIHSIEIAETVGSLDTHISGLTADSRAVKPDYLFVAVPGTVVDGHAYIDKAIAAGAKAIVCEKMPAELKEGVAYVRTNNAAKALGILASEWFGNPSSKLKLIGVTGTNGKTTIATLLYEMARLNGQSAGLLSTVVNKIEDTDVPSTHTTPDPIELNSLLARMVEAGCTFAAMEVSSHAAAQHRIAGLKFAGGVFTNLTRDHLDYHKTFDAYLAAKKSFFDSLPADAFALTNADDRNGDIMLQNTKAKRYAYSLRSEADFRGAIVENRLDGMCMSFNGKEVETLFSGRFNASNLTAVYGASVLAGFDADQVLVDMSRLVPVAGRFQPFRSADGVTAIVDYAHTPDALVNVLQTIRDIVGNAHRVITVCGAGGNRDHGKRPIMAAEADRRSDVLILTSDNPRDEKPEDILNDMLAGLTDESRQAAIVIVDRREAINRAVSEAAPGDVVLIAGKGHEDYQIIAGVKHHFDDRKEVKIALSNRTDK